MRKSEKADGANRLGDRGGQRLGRRIILPAAVLALALPAAVGDGQARDLGLWRSAIEGNGWLHANSGVVFAQSRSSYDVQDVPIYTRDWVSELQSRMKAAGFDPGTQSGAFTKDTRDTIKKVQKEYGLEVTGQPTPSLMRKLRSLALQPGQSG
ncbi:MAG: peptidoglycan-binding domain-containing protein [Rhodovibrionaceae bacterium]|nr:peptidoglycan-binding domain-containing protein [Rhodovibrionaceae bacterium]